LEYSKREYSKCEGFVVGYFLPRDWGSSNILGASRESGAIDKTTLDPEAGTKCRMGLQASILPCKSFPFVSYNLFAKNVHSSYALAPGVVEGRFPSTAHCSDLAQAARVIPRYFRLGRLRT